jgi:hypothetical protein
MYNCRFYVNFCKRSQLIIQLGINIFNWVRTNRVWTMVSRMTFLAWFYISTQSSMETMWFFYSIVIDLTAEIKCSLGTAISKCNWPLIYSTFCQQKTNTVVMLSYLMFSSHIIFLELLASVHIFYVCVLCMFLTLYFLCVITLWGSGASILYQNYFAKILIRHKFSNQIK